MKTNAAGIALIKSFEGLRLTSYKCPAGVLTIGYGHTSAAGLPKVVPGMTITADEAGEILIADLAKYEWEVADAITKFCNENQFAAMVSLCYNIGPSAFRKSSVCRWFNAGQPFNAAGSFKMWNKAGGKILPGLVKRRLAETNLFLKPVQNIIPERVQPPLPPDLPDVHVTPELPPAPPWRPTIQQTMLGVIVAIAGAIGAWLGWG